MRGFGLPTRNSDSTLHPPLGPVHRVEQAELAGISFGHDHHFRR